MSWKRSHQYDAETLDAELERVRRELDHSHYGPSSFFDPDREERWDDFSPSETWPAVPLVAGQRAPSSSLSAAQPPRKPRSRVGEARERAAGDEEGEAA